MKLSDEAQCILSYKVSELRKSVRIKPAWHAATNDDLHAVLEIIEEIVLRENGVIK